MKKSIFIIFILVVLIGGAVLALRSLEKSVGASEHTTKDMDSDTTVIDDTTDEDTTDELPIASGVRGQILLSPTCPVLRDPPDPNCADKPYQTTIQVVWIPSSNSEPYATMETDEDGNYGLILPPGLYSIQPIGGQPFPTCSSTNITVEPDTIHEVNLACDTGIR